MGFCWSDVLSPTTIGPAYEKVRWFEVWNPNREIRGGKHDQFLHPVKGGLACGKIAIDANDTAAFKIAQAQILEYLEPQCCHIMKASDNILKYLAEERRQCGILCAEYIDKPRRWERCYDMK